MNKSGSLSFEEYQTTAHQTAVYDDRIYPWLALAEETGELLGKMAKVKRGDGISDTHAIYRECGDVLWQLSEICTQMGFSLEAVADANLAKLADRRERNQLQGEGDNR